MEPLSTNHPAHPDAPAGSPLPMSRTLAYSQSDMPRLQPIQPMNAATHSDHGSGERSQTVVGEGSVVATVPTASQVVVDHEAIAGFMDAMTMGYRVEPPKLLDGVKAGDRVRFTIDVPKRTIIAIEPIR
jgi:Cu/Ag efflux protein CusF